MTPIVPAPCPELFQQDRHPRLFFGTDEVAAIRRKSEAGIGARIRAEILTRCAQYSDPAGDTYVDPQRSVTELLEGFGGGQPNRTSDALHCLAFGHLLTSDSRWLAHARALLRRISSGGSVLPTGGFETNVCYASFGGQLMIAYDLLWPALPEDERQQLRDFIRARIIDRYETDVLTPSTAHSWGLGTNVFLRNFEKYVLAVAVVYDPAAGDAARLGRAADMLRQAIHLGIDEGGAIYEGPSYGWRDAEWYAFMAEVLLRLGIADLWHEEPRFAAFYRHWVHLVLPNGRGQNNYCDAHACQGNRPHTGLLLAARRLADPALQWAYEQLGGRDHPGLGKAPERFSQNLGQTLLWETDQAPAPLPAQYPLARCSGAAGVITMRSGWGDDDAYLSLLASTRTHGNHIHQQTDAGHFSFHALGDAYSVDSGYGDIQGVFHSLMRPRAEEPSRGPRGFGQMPFGGRVRDFAAGRDADYGCVDIGEQWECVWAYRHALLIKAPGANPYALIVDNMNHNGAYQVYQWQLNSEPGNRIEIDAEHERAVVYGSAHRLEVAWAYPAADEYAAPHMLRLEEAEIDSAPLGSVDPGAAGMHGRPWPQGYGIGRRPQLRAKLLGYNGQLATALIPRQRGQSPIQLRWLSGREQFGFELTFDDVSDTVVVSSHSGNIELDGLRGEAKLAVIRRHRAGQLQWWAAAEAYALELDETVLLPRRGEPAALAQGRTS